MLCRVLKTSDQSEIDLSWFSFINVLLMMTTKKSTLQCKTVKDASKQVRL